ncbi:DctP family TRAP transporter solute-binding subunit [Anaerotalea alkaliphila]|uniref:DctP family TRAP transporter solute-binding subunit n=1 Tax=Anaerotalea alkaliphila TaxID=2662126 RepID=A0A7X5KNK8_9FIRM|nr:DctP family TRAP transporter solute-binding subunit [Anaerotalea alkaliphila]NDL66857.1 DctP family TRAP transporter solute-binding subunit [Anaerotalea alkaliphila]
MKRKLVAIAASALILMSALTGCGGTGGGAGTGDESIYPKMKLRMTVNGTDIATDTKVAHRFSELVGEASGGNIEIKVFSNDQLSGGNATKAVEMVAQGATEISAYASSVMGVLDQRLRVGTIPWIFDNYQEARATIDSTGGAYYSKLLAEKGLTYMGSFHNGFRQITNSKRPVRTPEDVKGLKIRVPGGDVYISFWKALGADPVAMSWSEVFTAIQQGTIDGQENGFSVTNSANMYEIQDYMTVWNYTYENYLFIMNSDRFDSMTPETQSLLREKALEASEWGRDLVEDEEKVLMEKFREAGMEVTELASEELVPFKELIKDLQVRFIETYGTEAAEAFGLQ